MLPIDGRGHGSVTIVPPKFDLSYIFEEYDKRGRKYMKITNQKFHWEPELLKFQFENLIGGDRALGESIKGFFNDNWQAILNDAGPSCDVALGQIFAAI
ncbi:hypothetical protein MTP99_007467 [Tenebrio molitor]|nr:hypothetical protein MTP99_007467 [Tenebrio molitor]